MFHVREEVQDAIRSLADSFDELLFILKDLPPEERQKYCNAQVLGPMSAFLNRAEPFEPIWRDKPTVQTLVSSFPEEVEEEVEDEEVSSIHSSVNDFFPDRNLTKDQAESLETASSRLPAKVPTRILPSRKET